MAEKKLTLNEVTTEKMKELFLNEIQAHFDYSPFISSDIKTEVYFGRTSNYVTLKVNVDVGRNNFLRNFLKSGYIYWEVPAEMFESDWELVQPMIKHIRGHFAFEHIDGGSNGWEFDWKQ